MPRSEYPCPDCGSFDHTLSSRGPDQYGTFRCDACGREIRGRDAAEWLARKDSDESENDDKEA